jgi:hypothetical protein
MIMNSKHARKLDESTIQAFASRDHGKLWKLTIIIP